MSSIIGSITSIYIMALLVAIPASIDMGVPYLFGALAILAYMTLALTALALAFLVGENAKRLIDKEPLTFRFWE